MDNESDYIDEYLLVETRTKQMVYSFSKHDVKDNTLKFQYIKRACNTHPNKYELYEVISPYKLVVDWNG